MRNCIKIQQRDPKNHSLDEILELCTEQHSLPFNCDSSFFKQITFPVSFLIKANNLGFLGSLMNRQTFFILRNMQDKLYYIIL